MAKINMKYVIYDCIKNIITRNKTKYAKLEDIYKEVALYLEVENNTTLQSQIRGRLQECCEQYTSFTGEALFLTEKIRSGNWTIKKTEKKYIRYKNNTFLVSEDDWETVTKENNISSDYNRETNLERVYQAKLIYSLGKEKANIIINELNTIRSKLKKYPQSALENDGYGIAFEIFSASVIHNIDYEDCINNYKIHGNEDGKIDIIYLGDSKYAYVYQIKMDTLGDNAYYNMEKNIDDCLHNIVPKNGKNLFEFYKKNEEKIKSKEKIIYRSVSENSEKDGNFKPDKIYEMFFENKLLPETYNNLILEIIKPSIRTGNSMQYNISTDERGNYIFYIKAQELINSIYKSLGIMNVKEANQVDISKYFTDNVRGMLSINSKIVNTIKNEPENFVKYNNGINITGEVIDNGHELKIKNPIINNGQQTITTILNINTNLDKIIIPIKITNESDMIIKGRISQYSNEQVKVKAIDMLSLNSYVRNIQKIIFQKTYNNENYFLEIYSSGKKAYYDFLKKLYNPENIINLLDFMKLYFSVVNNKELGAWKNSPNYQVEKTDINEFFDETLSFKVCESIVRYSKFIKKIDNKKEKDDFKSADLAFKYLICKENLTEEEAADLIRIINKKYYYDIANEKSKLIDIYKSTTIISILNTELEIFRNNKKLVRE